MSQAFPPKSKFTVDQIPDLSGLVTIVTGIYESLDVPVCPY